MRIGVGPAADDRPGAGRGIRARSRFASRAGTSRRWSSDVGRRGRGDRAAASAELVDAERHKRPAAPPTYDWNQHRPRSPARPFRVPRIVLSALLAYAADDPATAALAARGRPRVRLAVAEAVRRRRARAARTRGRPLLVVAGDDRHARDLAADLRAWLAPRPGALLPEPRRHLRVAPRAAAAPRRPARRGARRAARRRRGHGRARRPGRRRLAPSRCRRRSPTRRCARTASRSEAATCSTSTSAPPTSSPPATSASSRSRTAASSRSAAACSTSSPRRRTTRPRRPVRRRDRVAALVLDVHAALARRRRRRSRSRRPPSSRPSTASWPRSRRSTTRAERRDVAELLPVDDFHAMLDLVPDAAVLIAAEEEIAPALVDHWQDVCAAFHDEDAHHLYIAPGAIETALERARAIRLSRDRPGPAVPVPRRRRPTSPRAASRTPSRSWRSSCAPATARSSRSAPRARASAPPTTSAA